MIRADLRRLHAQGLTNCAISGQLGCHVRYVKSALKNMGLVANTRATRAAKIRDLIPALHAAGHNDLQIAKQISVSARAVQRARHSLGLAPIGRHPKRST